MPSYVIEVNEGLGTSPSIVLNSPRSSSSCVVTSLAHPGGVATSTPGEAVHEAPVHHVTTATVHHGNAVTAFASEAAVNAHQGLVKTLTDENIRLKGEAERLRAITSSTSKHHDLRNDMLHEQERDLMALEQEVAQLRTALKEETQKRTDLQAADGRARYATQQSQALIKDAQREIQTTWKPEVARLNEEIHFLKQEREATRAKVAQYEEETVRWQKEVQACMASREDHFAAELQRLRHTHSAELTSALPPAPLIDRTPRMLKPLEKSPHAHESLLSHNRLSISPVCAGSSVRGEEDAVMSPASLSRPGALSSPSSLVTLKDDLTKAVERLRGDVKTLSARPTLSSAQEALEAYRTSVKQAKVERPL